MDTARESRRELADGVETLRRELKRLREREGILGRAADRWSQLNGLGPVLDRVHQGVVASSPGDGGRIEWVNIAFCAKLGYTRAQIVDMGWRRLVDPTQIAATQVAESDAHFAGVLDYVNRFRRADGKWLQLRWWSTTYVAGIAWAVVEFEKVTEDTGEAST